MSEKHVIYDDMSHKSTIRLENVSVTFEKYTVLHKLNLLLDERLIAVIGANGSGKSTFVRLLNGLVLPTEGNVTINGFDTRREGKAVRRIVGFVFQNPDNQIIMPTVEEDITFGIKKLKKEEIERRIEETLQRYGLLSLRKKRVHLLSGGQKQLLAICGVLVMEPHTIILDEPTTQLDLYNRKRIAEIIDNLEQRIIMTSHDLLLLKKFERILVLHEGHLIYDASPSDAIPFYERLMA
ncbi:MAG: biotin transport system ATP-binding protein [Candidatus Tokpelaia sp. JSC085]|nr:MAG: biotin transport system ATP-binding protein [Candidatus Tokpelaia sp. JSC085]